MAADDFFDALPIAPLTPEELGLSPAPIAPAAPVLGPSPQDKRKHLIGSLAQLAAAIGAGPGPVGRGVGQGFLQAQQQQQVQQQRADQQAQLNYRQQQTDYEQQERQYQAEQARREANWQRNVTALRTAIARAPTKEDAEKQYQAFAAGMQTMGLRVNPNILRTAAPYVAPTSEAKAQQLLEKWMKNPSNADLLKESPEQAVKVIVPFDRDGDGVTERILLQELAALAQMPFAEGPEGGLMFSEKGTTADIKANADGILQQLIAQAKSEGKEITPQLTMALQQQAIKAAKAAEPKGPSPESETRKNIRIQSIQSSFENAPIVKEYNVILGKAGSIKQILDAGLGGPGDLAIVYEFMKALDPNSVVRETEYATAAASGNIFRGIWARFNGMLSPHGGFLSPQVKNDFLKLINIKLQAQRAQYDNFRNEKAKQIDRVTKEQGTGADYLVDYGAAFSGLDDTAPATTPAISTAEEKLNRR